MSQHEALVAMLDEQIVEDIERIRTATTLDSANQRMAWVARMVATALRDDYRVAENTRLLIEAADAHQDTLNRILAEVAS